MAEINLNDQFKNLPPDKQAEILARYTVESAQSGIEKPGGKAETIKTAEATVPGVTNLTEAEKLAGSGNIPTDKSIDKTSAGNAEVVLPQQEDTTKFLVRNIDEAELIDPKGNPKMDLNAFLDNIQERVANPLNSDIDPKNRVN